MNRVATSDLESIKRGIAALFQNGQIVEIRALSKSGPVSGYFQDYQQLAAAIKRLSDSAKYSGVYYTLNPCNESVLARRERPNVVYRVKAELTKDVDIERRDWLLFDVDFQRPAETSTTELEKTASRWCAIQIRDELRKAGWPEPVFAESGNNYHLLYRVDLPNDAETSTLVKKVLEAAHERFGIRDPKDGSKNLVSVDTSVGNASRIVRAYGSVARKGEATSDCPHRMSRIISVPRNLRCVSRQQLQAFVSASLGSTDVGQGTAGPGNNAVVSSQKIEEFLKWGGVSIRSVGDYQGGMRWVLTECFFNREHNRGEVCVIQYANGALKYSCLHQRCAQNDWAKFRAAVEARKGMRFKFVESRADIPYESTPSGILWHRLPEKPDVFLTNFPARFTADITEDDGINSQHVYEIEACVNGQTRCVSVSAHDLTSSNWPLEKLGGKAVLLVPGATNRDRLRVALQLISTDMEERTVFTHMGWRKVDNQWIYLHAGGAISAQGFRDDIRVSLPKDLENFRLPAPPSGAQRLDALRASLRFLEIAPHRITVPAYAGIWRAVLGNPGFSQFFTGPTGTYKSSLASLCQAHFGAGFDWEHLPGSWRHTANATAELQFKLKDALFTVDDFVPQGSQSDVQRMHSDADKIFRSAANNAGRGRLDRNSVLKGAKPPRCFTLSTGEDIPRGQSLQARLWITDFAEGDIDFKKLKLCADDARRGLFSSAMSAYLQWVAARRDSIEKSLRSSANRYRDAAMGHGQHAKTPQLVAELAAGLRSFLLFARECGALTPGQVNSLFKDSWRALIDGAKIQTRGLADEEPARRFMSLISSALVNARDAHLGQATTGMAEAGAKGRCIGWVYGDNVLLDPENAYAVANELAKAQGVALSVDKRTLWKRLRQRGFLSHSDKDGHNTVVRQIGVRRQRVLCVPKDRIIYPMLKVVDASSDDSSL
jgi:hypothetical protein